jgi:hypothetical protein
MIKIADVYISDDGCGNYIVRLRGTDASYFTIANNELYFKNELETTARLYNASINLENLPNTLTPIVENFTVDRRNCTITTTTSTTVAPVTTTTTTTTTTAAPTTTTTTTSTTPAFINSVCAGNMISNGDFENISYTNLEVANGTWIPITLIQNNNTTNTFAHLIQNNGPFGFIMTSINLVGAVTYSGSFKLAVLYGENMNSRTINIYVYSGDSRINTIFYQTYSATPATSTNNGYEALNWQTKTFTFTAPYSNSFILVFQDALNSGSNRIIIDDICIKPV